MINRMKFKLTWGFLHKLIGLIAFVLLIQPLMTSQTYSVTGNEGVCQAPVSGVVRA